MSIPLHLFVMVVKGPVAYVDLDRSFVRIGPQQEPRLEFGRLWGHRIGGWLQWSQLLDRRRVVLLSEASAGKTTEFRYRAEVLRDDGEAAFFVAIEELVDFGLCGSMDSGHETLLDSWLRGSRSGFFFLDSVDEARLNKKNFRVALRRFAGELGSALDRACVFVSCRVSDWKEPEDRNTLVEILPFQRERTSVEAIEDPDHLLLEPILGPNSNKRRSAVVTEVDSKDELLIVQLAPLSDEERGRLAESVGVQDSGRFVSAITKFGLDTLAERPGDLLELAEYWSSLGRFGTLAQMTEHGVERKLSERDKYRPDNNALTPDDARRGVERVAAAMTLCKSFILKAPGLEADTVHGPQSLDPAQILPRWTDFARNALVRRAIFAPSTYGRVRFHHRATQEFLTASWLNRLIANGCPSAAVHGLLFVDVYGIKTVVPSLRAVAAWLALKNADIRDEIIERDALQLLRHGDPGELDIQTRKRLLLAYSDQHVAGRIPDDMLDNRSLWMFADVGLASTIREAWGRNSDAHFRSQLLALVREGRIGSCVDLARDTALDDGAPSYHRTGAVEALVSCGDAEGLDVIAQRVMVEGFRPDGRLVSGLALLLFPEYLTVNQVLTLIENSPVENRRTYGGFASSIAELFEKCPRGPSRIEFVIGITTICRRLPHDADYRPISKSHTQLAGQLEPIAVNLIRELSEKQEPPDYLLELLMVIERADRDSAWRDGEPSLVEMVRRNTALNRGLFWRDVEDTRLRGELQLGRYWEVAIYDGPLWSLEKGDLHWLLDDLCVSGCEQNKRVALSAIAAILGRESRLEEQAPGLRSRVSDSDTLLEDLESYLRPKPDYDSKHKDRIDKIVLKRRKQREQDRQAWVSFREEVQKAPHLLSEPTELTRWPGISRLLNLTSWLERFTGEEVQSAGRHWRSLESAFGRSVANSYRDGMKQLWRVTKPRRPKRVPGVPVSIEWKAILSFAGLGIEAAEDPGWTSRLSPDEVKRAVGHCCLNELGYPDWLDSLLADHPDLSLPILRRALREEWSSDSGGPSDLLYRYRSPNHALPEPVAHILRNVIMRGKPASGRRLDDGVRILQRMDVDRSQARRIARFAIGRFKEHVEVREYDKAISYLALLFHVDFSAAVRLFSEWLDDVRLEQRASLSEKAFGTLFGESDPMFSFGVSAVPVGSLEQLVRLAYERVRPVDDNTHDGAYTPDARDKAEFARSKILNALIGTPGREAFEALMRIASDPAFVDRARRFRELAHGMAERDAEGHAWSIAEVLHFEQEWTSPISSDPDLFRTVRSRLANIAFSFERADMSSRHVLMTAVDEDAVQNWLAEQLLLRSMGQFHVHRESEVAAKKKPDMVISATAVPFEVALEVKHGGMSWSAAELERSLRHQLAVDYLKPQNRRHGVFVVTHHKPNRTWRHPLTRNKLSFSDLIAFLQDVGAGLMSNESGSIEVSVVGIDATGAT